MDTYLKCVSVPCQCSSNKKKCYVDMQSLYICLIWLRVIKKTFHKLLINSTLQTPWHFSLKNYPLKSCSSIFSPKNTRNSVKAGLSSLLPKSSSSDVCRRHKLFINILNKASLYSHTGPGKKCLLPAQIFDKWLQTWSCFLWHVHRRLWWVWKPVGTQYICESECVWYTSSDVKVKISS